MSALTFVVPLDGTERALVALPVAKRLADLEGATLHLIHVARQPSVPVNVLECIGITGSELRGSILDTRTGDPATEILEAANELQSALIIMCTHTAIPAASKTIGSTALSILKRAPCPVVLVHPDRGVVPWVLQHILLPHDGTPTTSAALHPAAKLARLAHAELTVLYVEAPGVRLPVECGSLRSPRYTDQPQHEWPAWAGEFLERLGSMCPLESLNVRMSLTRGSPADETLHFAIEHESNLIVLAWLGEWEGDHAATLKAVIRGAVCPVMIIRARH